MRKYINIIIFALMIGFNINLHAQCLCPPPCPEDNATQDLKNMKKYWYYHYRLLNSFMVKGNCEGCSIPMNERALYISATNIGKWGDGTITLAQYISVLATEFKLLHDHNQRTDTTVQELYYAIRAMNRLDYTAETNHNMPGYGSGVNSLNGFFIRDDVPSNFLKLSDHPERKKLIEGNETSSRPISTTESTITGGSDPSMSMDQVLHLLQGFALIRKLILVIGL
jgi:hypothetical protein